LIEMGFTPSVVTSILVIAVSGAAMFHGVETTRYETEAFAGAEASPETAAAFASFLGLRGRARRALAPEYSVETATRAEIENVIAVEPANGFYWLALAENLADGGEARDRMLAALHMSEAVQPHEAATMGRRAALILSLWEQMPRSDRRLAASQLVELGERVAPETRARIVRIVAAQPDSVRAEVRDEIVERAGDDRRLLTFLGL
jgi:hypothetical protein